MIEKATIDDISELVLLVNSAYRGESSKKGWTTEALILNGIRIDEKEMADIFANTESIIFKYKENKTILGCVLLVKKQNKVYLGMLCVNPELQNSGIGKKILHFAENFAHDNGLNRIVMTVISERKELISWYNRHGYLDLGEREAFPASHQKDIISGKSLEFIVLEKLLTY